jgi:2-polyprenyl-6-hydroxyphenyl methylase/3-demethylubiquinone-9 3-methyltransferase
MHARTVDDAEVAKFEAMAAQWWDPRGDAAPLHRLNPCRLDYIADEIAIRFGRDRRDGAPFEGLELVDVGCGGGLVAEPMARLGARVTGLDASGASIGVARAHAAQGGLAIDYRDGTVQTLAAQGAGFDVALALEIVEHLPDIPPFLAALADVVRPGGLVILSTINRTPQSFAKAIVGAEYLLRWLPRGTHDWRRFVTPDELAGRAAQAGLEALDRTGMVFSPLTGQWRLSADDLSVNYLLTARKPGG